MTIRYICPYCGMEYASINNSSVEESALGFASLTVEERDHIISYESNGDVIARVSCQYCSEAVNRNPELMYPLQ